MFRRAALALATASLTALAWAQAPFSLTILHTNDTHARIMPSRISGQQMGGWARLATLIRNEKATQPNPLLLDAGDVFQGTIYFNVYQGLADLAIMNSLGYHAMAVGNHEFDKGPAALGRFARHAQFPLLSANLDVSTEPELAALVLPATTVEVGGETIGVVGATTDSLPYISSPGPNVGMKPTVPAIQAAVDALLAQGVNKVVLLSHSGYEEDKAFAGELRGVDVIVGGHSHTMLGHPPANLPYPTVVRNPDGGQTLVVQAWQWALHLGRIRVDFDPSGTVTGWSDGAPLVVSIDTPEDPLVRTMISAFEIPVAAEANRVVGEASTEITNAGARSGENAIGNLIADAMLAATQKAGSVAAFWNAGGVRAPIDAGPITYGEALTVLPFSNTLVVLELSGAELKAAFEHGAVGLPGGSGAMLHPSHGTSYTVDTSRPQGDRVVDIIVGGQPWQADATYVVTFSNFTSNGGDAHEALKNAQGKRLDTGLIDVDAFVEFLGGGRPVGATLEGRIVVK